MGSCCDAGGRMDYLRIVRLFFYFAVGLLLGGFGSYASATVVSENWYYQYGHPNTISGDSGSAACTSLCNTDTWTGSPPGFTLVAGPDSDHWFCKSNATGASYACNGSCPAGSPWNASIGHCVTPCVAPLVIQPNGTCASPATSCPPGLSLDPSTGVCKQPSPSCPSGQIRDLVTQNCRTDCSLLAGQKAITGAWYYNVMSSVGCSQVAAAATYSTGMKTSSGQPITTGQMVMPNGCAAAVFYVGGGVSPSGSPTCYISATYGGDAPGTSPNSPPQLSNNPTPQPCGAGQCYGTVNGQSMCVTCGSINTPNPTTTTSSTTNSDGSVTTTTKVCDPDGTCTTSSTTTINGVTVGSPITTKTTGPGTGTNPGDTPPSSFCTDNPSSPLCKTSSISGSCTGFTCDGDAVQCAIASQQYKLVCDFEKTSDMSDLGNQVVAGNDPLAASNPTAPANVIQHDLSTSIDQSRFLSSSGMADKTISVAGKSFVIPFSKANPVLDIMGAIVVTFSLLAAVRIVGGA